MFLLSANTILYDLKDIAAHQSSPFLMRKYKSGDNCERVSCFEDDWLIVLKYKMANELQNPASHLQLKESFTTKGQTNKGHRDHRDANHVRHFTAPSAMF